MNPSEVTVLSSFNDESELLELESEELSEMSDMALISFERLIIDRDALLIVPLLVDLCVVEMRVDAGSGDALVEEAEEGRRFREGRADMVSSPLPIVDSTDAVTATCP